MKTALRKVWGFSKILFVRLRFILVFAGVGLLVGNWDYLMNVVDRWTRPGSLADAAHGEFEWFCPMHPTVVRNDPKAKCPICGMPLSKRKRGEKAELPAGVLSRLQLSPFRIRQAGLATEEVGFRSLVRELRTVGTVEFDERKLARITARTGGRADRLFVDFTGTAVKEGEPLVDLYSPELVTTQEEYLLALKALEDIRAQAPAQEEAVSRARRLAEAARERLTLWGITDAQIKALELAKKVETHLKIHSPVSGTVIAKEIVAGQYVEEGTELYRVADLSMVWVEADVFERDLGLVKLGQTIQAESEAYPGETFSGAVSFVHPTLRTDTRTVRIRMDVRNPDGKLKPGMYVTAVLRVPLGRQGEVFYGC